MSEERSRLDSRVCGNDGAIRARLAGFFATPERRALAAVLALAAAYFAWYLLPLDGFEHAFPIDDSYITLTAARNLAEHNSFTINPEAPGAGITSPLHVILVGLLGKAVGVEPADRFVGLLALLFLVAGAFAWARQLGAGWPAATLASVLTIVTGPAIFGALNGLETDLFAALLIWTFVAVEKSREQRRWTYGLGALVGLAALTRPEGYFLAAAVFGVRAFELLWRRNVRGLRDLAAAAGIAGAALAPYLLFNLLAQGHFFPPTVSAKKYFFSLYCRSFHTNLAGLREGLLHFHALLGFGVVLLPFAFRWLRRGYPLLFLAIFYAAYLVEFVGALTHYWGRYQHPLMPPIFVGVAVGAETIAGWMRRRRPDAGKWFWRIAVGLLVFQALSTGRMHHGIYRHAITSADDYGYLMAVAKVARENTEPGDLIAAHDIGILSYFGDRPLLDLVGLTDPEAARINKQFSACRARNARAKELYEYLQRRRPKLVIFFPDWDHAFLGLLWMDGGRHMKLFYRHQKTRAEAPLAQQRHAAYDFYLCDWDHDLRPEQLPRETKTKPQE